MIVRIPYSIPGGHGECDRAHAEFRVDSDDPEQVKRIITNGLYYALKVAADEEGVRIEPV